MAQFSVSTAYGAGFKLIGRAPFAPLAWGLLAALVAAPAQLMQMNIWPAMADYYGNILENPEAGASDAMTAQLMTASTAMNAVTMVSLPFTLLVFGMVFAAICRSILEPEDRRFSYLRLSKRELWVALVTLVLGVLVVVGIFAILLGGGIVVALLIALSGGSGWMILLSVLLILAMVVGGLWLLGRLSMAIPMSFDERRFLMFESWAFTAGQGWKLFGLGLLVTLTVWAIQLAAFAVAAAVVAAFALRDLASFQASLSNPESWLGDALPYLVLAGVGWSILSGYTTALVTAPFADAYRQIIGPRGQEEVF